MNGLKDTTPRMIPGRTKIGTVRGKYEGAVNDYDIYYGNIAVAPDSTLVHMDRGKYLKVLDRFLESGEGRQYRRPSEQEMLEAERKFCTVSDETEEDAEEMTAVKKPERDDAETADNSMHSEEPAPASESGKRTALFCEGPVYSETPEHALERPVRKNTLFTDPGKEKKPERQTEKQEKDTADLAREIRNTDRRVRSLEILSMLFFIVLTLASCLQLAITAGILPAAEKNDQAQATDPAPKDTAVRTVVIDGETVSVPVIDAGAGSSDVQLYAVITSEDEYGMYSVKTAELGKLVMADREYIEEPGKVQEEPSDTDDMSEEVPEAAAETAEPEQYTETEAAGIPEEIPQQ